MFIHSSIIHSFSRYLLSGGSAPTVLHVLAPSYPPPTAPVHSCLSDLITPCSAPHPPFQPLLALSEHLLLLAFVVVPSTWDSFAPNIPRSCLLTFLRSPLNVTFSAKPSPTTYIYKNYHSSLLLLTSPVPALLSFLVLITNSQLLISF